MRYASEKNVIKELLTYSKSQFVQEKRETREDGSIFYSFSFVRKKDCGYITATYFPKTGIYNSIDMDCNFCRSAGFNNYPMLKDVMNHIISLFN